MRILVFLLLLGNLAYCQTNPVVSATEMNILYRGIENPVSIAVPEWPCSALTIEIHNGTISGDSCTYTIRPGAFNQTKLTVKTISGNDTTEAGVYQFRVRSIPQPVAYFAGVSGENNIIEKMHIQAAIGVTARLQDLSIEPHIPILSFEMVIKKVNGEYLTTKSESARVTPDMKVHVETLQSGDQVDILNILVSLPDKEISELDDITMTIK